MRHRSEPGSSATEELGAPSVLVNNAGILRDNLLLRMSVDDWDDVMGVHLRGSFLMSREVQGHMRTAGWGVSSICRALRR